MHVRSDTGMCTTRSVSRGDLCLVFVQTINHMKCCDCAKNRLDIKSDTLALTLMVSAWEPYCYSGVVKPTEAHMHSVP